MNGNSSFEEQLDREVNFIANSASGKRAFELLGLEKQLTAAHRDLLVGAVVASNSQFWIGGTLRSIRGLTPLQRKKLLTVAH